jgi:acetyl esterase/lipase
MCARLAKRASATVTVIDYRLAPEHVYPAAVDDCVAAYRALIADVDPALVTIAGDSAGGGATLATLGALRAAGDPMPGAVYVLSPWADLTASGESVVTRAPYDPMFDGDGLIEAATTYAGDTPLDDPGVSPLFADPTGYPPTLIQTGMDEILLSDSTRLAERYAAAGVEVRLDLRDDLWHVYPILAGYMPEATDALVRAAVFIREKTPAPLLIAQPA